MIFKTACGLTYAIDDARRSIQSPGDGATELKFSYVTNLYVGSKGVAFHDESGDIILHISREVVEIEGDPNARVDGEEGNLVIRTQNSTYEFNQEQLLVRRLAGLNPATNPKYPDGDWRPYLRIDNLAIGRAPFVVYGGDDIGKAKHLSTVREIIGTYIPPYEPIEHPLGDVTIVPDQI